MQSRGNIIMKHKLLLIRKRTSHKKGIWLCERCDEVFAFYMMTTKQVEDYVNKYYAEPHGKPIDTSREDEKWLQNYLQVRINNNTIMRYVVLALAKKTKELEEKVKTLEDNVYK